MRDKQKWKGLRRKSFISIFGVIACWVATTFIWTSPTLHKFQLQAAGLNAGAYIGKTELQQSLPPGVILGWTGSIDAVPDGWALCNGENGTPDLRDRFVVGFYKADIGQTGGRADHSHEQMLHDHLVYNPGHRHVTAGWDDETEEAGEHSHTFGPATGKGPTVDEGCIGLACYVLVDRQGHSHGTRTTEGIHKHGIQIPDRMSSMGEGSRQTTKNGPVASTALHLPPYYEIAFIIKLPQVKPPFEANVSGVPAELVVAWSGSLGSLPDGWVLCNGENGTPDLHGKFILGAESENSIGMEKISSTHTHTLDSHRHNVTIPAHSHMVSNTSRLQSVGNHTHRDIGGTGVYVDRQKSIYQAADPDHTHSISSAGAHTHELVVPDVWTSKSSGTGFTEPGTSQMEEASHVPPFYKVAFIKKSKDLIKGTIEPLIFPVGVVAMWSGPVADLPQQWALCDGVNRTPDLRGRFLVGTDNNTGEIGGQTTHKHSMAPHAHTAAFPHDHPDNIRVVETTEGNSKHRHDSGGSTSSAIEADRDSLDEVWVSDGLHYHTLWHSGAHTHSLELGDDIAYQDDSLQTSTSEADEGKASGENMPPYYKLAFVVRVGTPEDPGAPKVTTTAISSITSTSASSGGDVTSDGGASVTARGVCWSISGNPTTSDSHTSDGTGTGSFTSDISGLSPITTYHVRAYATNSIGTSYGDDVFFFTSASEIIYVETEGVCRGESPCFVTIEEGIDWVSDGAAINIGEGTYDEDIILDEPKKLLLLGGWDAEFISQTSVTTANGLIIRQGKIITYNLILGPLIEASSEGPPR